MTIRILSICLLALCTGGRAADRTPIDTQPEGAPLLPHEATARFRVPDGFKVTLAAAEPAVRQPIALAYDDRGRLWVAESYSYAGSHFTDDAHDRILIFEDADGDGVFESRRVFHDGLSRLTGLTLGFGGVWITAPPLLAFIPDRDGDDQPDGPPVVHLDGWTPDAEHNNVNGLTWGPDGWLYGRHGIKKGSLVGAPGTPASARTELSCSIWRYHPTRHLFEVVADGAINPWGLDFDAHGQAFMSTSVVDHLWHVVPGARFERWKDRGGHPDPYVYELMTPTSDHLHWGGGTWDRGGRLAPSNDELGGGHSHSDAMIYQGDRWPAEYHGTVLMSNIHGRRINRDALVRHPATGRYTATHLPDFITVDDPWFRAISLVYGPDGDVVLSDWSDHGECHDRDGVHRSSGRLYKISWGEPRRMPVNLGTASPLELAALQTHRNEWFVRHARRRLQELANDGTDLTEAHAALREQFRSASDSSARLRALWALHAAGAATPDWLLSLITHSDEHLRHWSVRLAADLLPADRLVLPLTELARTEDSWLVHVALASALPRFDLQARLALVEVLGARLTPSADPNLVRLLWYSLQPSIPADPKTAGRLALDLRVSRLRGFIARRLAEDISTNPGARTALFAALAKAGDKGVVLDLLNGANRGLQGQVSTNPPFGALIRLAELMRSPDPQTRRAAALLAATFGDSSAINALRTDLNDPAAPLGARTAALDKLAVLHPPWLLDDLLTLLRDGPLIDALLRTLPAFADARVTDAVVAIFPSLPPGERGAAIDALVARPSSARALLDAVAAGQFDRRFVTLNHARQIARLGDSALATHLDRVWGAVTRPSGETNATLIRLRTTLSPAVLAEANIDQGAAIFELRCAACHKLFGRGQNLGPDLTGSGRKDLEYLLLSIIDPSASISADWRLTIVTLDDGRVLSGGIVAETPRTITIRSTAGETTIDPSTVRSIERLPISIMPAGLLDSLSHREVRDLFGYLMSDGPGAR